MIDIDREGTKVKITITIDDLNHRFIFSHDTGGDGYAKILKQKIEDSLYKRIESVRKAEYNSGWKEAKSKKKPRRDWFFGFLQNKATGQ